MTAKALEIESQLPSPIAMILAASCGLLQYDPNISIVNGHLEETPNRNEELQLAWRNRLSLFQQMTLAGADYVDCKVVYKDFKLEDKHTKVLKLIHKHSGDWVRGAVVDELLKHTALQNKFVTGDPTVAAALIDKLLDKTIEVDVDGDGTVSGKIQIDITDAKL